MPLIASNLQIHQVYGELDDILGNGGLISRLPQALVDRLSAMRGMLLEALLNSTEANSDGELLAAELCRMQARRSMSRRDLRKRQVFTVDQCTIFKQRIILAENLQKRQLS